MEHAARHGGSDDGELIGLLEKRHHRKAADGAAEGIEGPGEAREQKSRHQDPDEVDDKCILCIHPVQGNHDDEVCKAELDARDSCLEGKDVLDIGKDDTQGGKHAAECYFLCAHFSPRHGVHLGITGGCGIVLNRHIHLVGKADDDLVLL